MKVTPSESSDAYAEVYRRHMSTVVAASRAILRFGPDSEDVATEVFVRLWMAPESFDPSRCSVVGFLRMLNQFGVVKESPKLEGIFIN